MIGFHGDVAYWPVKVTQTVIHNKEIWLFNFTHGIAPRYQSVWNCNHPTNWIKIYIDDELLHKLQNDLGLE